MGIAIHCCVLLIVDTVWPASSSYCHVTFLPGLTVLSNCEWNNPMSCFVRYFVKYFGRLFRQGCPASVQCASFSSACILGENTQAWK